MLVLGSAAAYAQSVDFMSELQSYLQLFASCAELGSTWDRIGYELRTLPLVLDLRPLSKSYRADQGW